MHNFTFNYMSHNISKYIKKNYQFWNQYFFCHIYLDMWEENWGAELVGRPRYPRSAKNGWNNTEFYKPLHSFLVHIFFYTRIYNHRHFSQKSKHFYFANTFNSFSANCNVLVLPSIFLKKRDGSYFFVNLRRCSCCRRAVGDKETLHPQYWWLGAF